MADSGELGQLALDSLGYALRNGQADYDADTAAQMQAWADAIEALQAENRRLRATAAPMPPGCVYGPVNGPTNEGEQP